MVDLKSIIRKKPDCLSSSGTVRGVLMDCGLERRTVQVMVNLYECGIIEKIRQCGGVLRQTEVYNLTVQQENYYGISRQFITDGISRWAEAMDVTVEGLHPTTNESKMLSGLDTVQRRRQQGKVALGTCGRSICWSYDGNGTLNIYGEGEISDYSRMEKAPWSDCVLTTVIVGQGITRIGTSAFASQPHLRRVLLEEGLISIGEKAFYNCIRLKKINFPSTLRNIEKEAFRYCQSLGQMNYCTIRSFLPAAL